MSIIFHNFVLQKKHHINTHSHCVFLCPTLKQGASKLQARKQSPTDTHSQCVSTNPKLANYDPKRTIQQRTTILR